MVSIRWPGTERGGCTSRSPQVSETIIHWGFTWNLGHSCVDVEGFRLVDRQGRWQRPLVLE